MRALPPELILFLFLAFVPSGARAEGRIADLEAALDGNQVLASVTLTGAFDRRLSERLASGLPTSILYHLELHKDRKRWYDRRLKATTIEATALYDAVEQQYNVHLKLDGELVESRTVRDRAALEEAMTRIRRLPVFTLEGLPRGWRVLVKARAELGSRTLLLVIPDAITTDWAESRKLRVP